MRPLGNTIQIYDRKGLSEIPLPVPDGTVGRSEVLNELCGAVLDGKPAPHDGQFGRATVSACLDIQTSAARNATCLAHAVPQKLAVR